MHRWSIVCQTVLVANAVFVTSTLGSLEMKTFSWLMIIFVLVAVLTTIVQSVLQGVSRIQAHQSSVQPDQSHRLTAPIRRVLSTSAEDTIPSPASTSGIEIESGNIREGWSTRKF
jgi:low affinity Fe/Cu permease